MPDPYTPPRTSENLSAPFRGDVIFRWIVVVTYIYLTVGVVLSDFIPVQSKVITFIFNSLLAIGVLRLGRKFHLGITILMLITIGIQAYLMNEAIANPGLIPVSIPSNPWAQFVRSIIPYMVILASTLALYFRSRNLNQAEQVGALDS